MIPQSPYRVVTVPGQVVTGNKQQASDSFIRRGVQCASLVPVSGQGVVWEGLQIDPTSQYRHLEAFFDGEDEGHALILGSPIRRKFSSVMIKPLYPAIYSGTTTVDAKFSPGLATPNLYPAVQSARLRFWRVPPQWEVFPQFMAVPLPRVSVVADVNWGAAGGYAVLGHLHVPGMTHWNFEASTEGANPQIITNSLWAWRADYAEYPQDYVPTAVYPTESASRLGANIGNAALAAGAPGIVAVSGTNLATGGGHNDLVILTVAPTHGLATTWSQFAVARFRFAEGF